MLHGFGSLHLEYTDLKPTDDIRRNFCRCPATKMQWDIINQNDVLPSPSHISTSTIPTCKNAYDKVKRQRFITPQIADHFIYTTKTQQGGPPTVFGVILYISCIFKHSYVTFSNRNLYIIMKSFCIYTTFP